VRPTLAPSGSAIGSRSKGNEARAHRALLRADGVAARRETAMPAPDGMNGSSLPPTWRLAGKFPWEKYRTFIDVGAAQGAVPVALAQVHSHLAGGGFDLPEVQTISEAYVARHGMIDDGCCENAAGLLMSLSMREAGFTRICHEHLSGPFSMLVGNSRHQPE
jgi:hypothetical protein